MTALDQAERFLWLNARLLDRLRFEFHFRGGDPRRVVDALRPYQNADGGFGHALEPDLRGPESQPVPVDVALFVLDEVGAVDGDLLPATLGYLESITRPDGAVPFVLPTALDKPRAPWWQTADDPPGALNPTAAILGPLHKHRIEHAWVRRATDFCWSRIDRMTDTSEYEIRAVLKFLEHVPDRSRAEAAWQRISPLVRAQVKMPPLDLAPTPQSLARSLFPADTVARELHALAARQKPDGGWDFDFESWTPITRPEWRGWVTIESLLRLRDNGHTAVPASSG
jgi:hypothetical protein